MKNKNKNKDVKRTSRIDKDSNIKAILTLIAITALVVGFFTLIGRGENQDENAPAVAEGIDESVIENAVIDENFSEDDAATEKLAAEEESLSEVAPAAGPQLPSGESEKVKKEVFGFE